MGDAVQFGRVIQRDARAERAERERRAQERQEGQAVAARLAVVESAVGELQKWSWPNGLRELFAEVLGETLREIEDHAEKRLRDAVAALREEMQVEVAVCRDELLQKVDAARFGSTLDYDPDLIKAAIRDVRRELDRHAEVVSARFDAQAARLDAIEHHADSREQDHKRALLNQAVKSHAGLRAAASGIAEFDKRLDALATELRQLRAILVEAEIVAPDSAPLLLPSA